MLYAFDKLDSNLDTLGYPKMKSGSGFQTIRTDFKQAYEAGKIEFREDGIHLIHEAQEWKGYMYMPTYKVSKYDSFSKFHITRCTVIDDFMRSGMFNTYYKWSNHQVNDIEDRDTGLNHPDKTLKVCSKCVSQLINIDIKDTEDFFNSLDKEKQGNQDLQVDIFGYVKGWEKISKAYRATKNYTCEECGVKCTSTMHRKWWHTHHRDGDKTNNYESNLECLCVCCHSRKDQVHEVNFNNHTWKRHIEIFVKLYRIELTELKSPCILHDSMRNTM